MDVIVLLEKNNLQFIEAQKIFFKKGLTKYERDIFNYETFSTKKDNSNYGRIIQDKI